MVSQILKYDLKIVRDHRQMNDMTFNYDQILNPCLTEGNDIH